MIGRAQQIDALRALLIDSTGAFLTLVGPAGVGKTRLAIEAANAASADFPDGVFYLDLAPVADPADVPCLVAEALGLSIDEPSAAELAGAFAERAALLVLDNAEHLLDVGPLLNAALQGAPQMRLLATSQAPFRVLGERELLIEPLPVADVSDAEELSDAELEAVADTPAIALFMARTQAVRPDFQLNRANLAAVLSICQRLDGLPLAIELAAARGKVLAPAALDVRLGRSFRLLRGGPIDALDRHQTLHAALEWSYRLLQPHEALLLDRLSVFAGSFSLAAAEAVGGDGPIELPPSPYTGPATALAPRAGQLDPDEVFDLLQALASHSLVQHIDDQGKEPRFRLLQTVRQFAAEQLIARGEVAATEGRHVAWYRRAAESTWDERGAPLPELSWINQLEADYDNLRAALDRLRAVDPAAASSMAAALVWFFYLTGRRREGLLSLDLAASERSALPALARGRVVFAQGTFMALVEQTRPAGIELLEALAGELEPLGPHWLTGYTLMVVGILAETEGDFDRVLTFVERARPMLERFADTSTLANLDYHRAVASFGRGELERARRTANRITRLPAATAGMNIAYARHLLAFIAIAEGNQAAAARQIRRALDFLSDYGFVATAAEALDGTATALALNGDAALVARLFGAASRQNEEAGNPITLPEKTWYDAAMARARAELGTTRYAEEFEAGRALSRDAAFELTREALHAMETGQPDTRVLPAPSRRTVRSNLTERELETLTLVVAGLTDREIAEQMGVSYATTRTHVRSILAKLNVTSRTAATTLALREGIVPYAN